MKTLIVYYSLTNNNEKLALYLKEKLNCDLFAIQTKKKWHFFDIFLSFLFKKKAHLQEYKIEWSNYERFIFIAPIWLGKIAFPLKTFLTEEKSNIKNYHFISICVGGQKEKLTESLTNILSNEPQSVEEISLKILDKDDKVNIHNHLSDKDFEILKPNIDKAIQNYC